MKPVTTPPRLLAATALLLSFTSAVLSAEYQYPFQNPDLPLEDRVNNIVSLMTLDEKVALLSQRPGVPRLGIRSMMQAEGLNSQHETEPEKLH
jgi:beta-glucosidase